MVFSGVNIELYIQKLHFFHIDYTDYDLFITGDIRSRTAATSPTTHPQINQNFEYIEDYNNFKNKGVTNI